MHPEPLLFTVFSPVYNRRKTLHRVWESLNSQHYRNFEWVVVNDGSTDDIESLLAVYQQQATFPMTVIHQPNKGKHGAWNAALKIAKGELFVPADSDDAFEPDALEKFKTYWEAIPKDQRASFSGINVLCKEAKSGLVVGDRYPHDGMVTNNIELQYKYQLKGEKWGCIRTELLQARPFPDVKGSFFTENYLWYQLAKSFNVVCYNTVLRTYFIDDGDRVSKLGSRDARIARTKYEYFHWQFQNEIVDYIKYGRFSLMIKDLMRYISCGLACHVSVSALLKDMPTAVKFWVLVLYAPTVGFMKISKAR